MELMPFKKKTGAKLSLKQYDSQYNFKDETDEDSNETRYLMVAKIFSSTFAVLFINYMNILTANKIKITVSSKIL